MVEEGAKAIESNFHVLCLKPETSEMQQKRFHSIVKVKNFSTFPSFPMGSAVLKNRYFRP